MGGPSDKAVKEGRGPWEGLMDREIWCTSGLRIRTWEIGTAGTRMGSVGRGGQLRTFSTPVQTPSWRYVPLLRAQLARATRAVPGFSWQCAVRQSHPRHTDGWVGGSRCNYRVCPVDQGVYLWQRGRSAQSRLPKTVCDCAKRIRFLWYLQGGLCSR